jgi:hypothetical protein
MNYLLEIVAFSEWKEVNPLPATAIALWYELMAICNKCGWIQEFTVSNGLLQIKAGLSRKEFDRARQILMYLGRITYRKSNRVNQAGIYSIIPIVQKGQQEGQQEGQRKGQQEEHTGGNERDTLFKPKLKPKLKNETVAGTPPTPKSPEKTLLDEYFKLFQAKFNGEKPVINGAKDMTLLKKLLGAHSKERLSQLLIDFFASEDPWIIDSGYTLGVFYVKLNKLLVARVNMEREQVESSGECKCDGNGWYVVFDPDANNGQGANKVVVCPCRKRKGGEP